MITKISNGKEIITGNFEMTKGLLVKDGVTAFDRAWWAPCNMGKTFIMLDLETLGLGFKPAIVQIAAVEFDLLTGLVLDEFVINVEGQSSIDAGLETLESTLEFWRNQPQEVQKRVFSNSVSLASAIESFSAWLAPKGDAFIWGNGVRADNVWILSAYRALGLADPFKYNRDLDYRTIYQLADMKAELKNLPKPWKDLPFEGLPHYALDDCKHQIRKAHLMWKMLND